MNALEVQHEAYRVLIIGADGFVRKVLISEMAFATV